MCMPEISNIAQKIYAKGSRKGRYVQRDIRYRLGLYDGFYKAARGCRILVYHGICQRDATKFNTLFLTWDTFEAHLKFYQRYFNVVSLNDYYLQRFDPDKFNVCLTFDDGFANNYKYVLPLLEQYQMPATLFVTAIREAGYDLLWNDLLTIAGKYGPEMFMFRNTSHIKNRHFKYVSAKTGIRLDEELRLGGFKEKAEMMKLLYPLSLFKTDKTNEDYWLQITKEQLIELAASPLVTIGSHGYYHNDLAKISLADVKEELSLSKQYLENTIGKQIASLAFPYGSYTTEVAGLAKQAGYNQLLATDFQYAEDHADVTMRERLTVNPFISVNNQMHATITGKYE
jgi:peptidoglycan/xylan/chitin deacetylase (PgdA/CDA1 family)